MKVKRGAEVRIDPAETLFTHTDLEEAWGLNLNSVSEMVAAGLFPRPVHIIPALWRASEVVEWAKRASVRARAMT